MPYQGDTIRIVNTVTDYNGQPLQPDSHTIQIYDSNGQLKTTITNPTEETLGTYYVDYTIPNDASVGLWRVVWKIVKGGKPNVEVLLFQVFKV